MNVHERHHHRLPEAPESQDGMGVYETRTKLWLNYTTRRLGSHTFSFKSQQTNQSSREVPFRPNSSPHDGSSWISHGQAISKTCVEVSVEESQAAGGSVHDLTQWAAD